MVTAIMGSAALILEDKVEKILNGGGLEVKELDSAPEQVKPVVLRKTVCYIVCAVIINAKNEVLMMQEAKPECYGRWYLPAGRMEEAESIVEAMQREVKEEAGVDCQPITLLLVQEQGPQWIRFVFLAEVTGGSIKTEAEADGESLQAQWWDRESPLPLRSRDILCLIEAGLKHREGPGFPPALPADVPCRLVCQRLLLAFCGRDDVDLWVLLSGGAEPRLPVAACGPTGSVGGAALRLLRECSPAAYRQLAVAPRGLLGLQHGGGGAEADGVCFNALLWAEGAGRGSEAGRPPRLENPGFRWHRVESARLRDGIRRRLAPGSLLPLHSLCC